MDSVKVLVGGIIDSIIGPLWVLLVALALLFFVWGLSQFILHADSEEGRRLGKEHLLWGIVGLFVMLGVLGILQILASSFGIDVPTR